MTARKNITNRPRKTAAAGEEAIGLPWCRFNQAAAMTNLGVLLKERGDAAAVTEAQTWYRRPLSGFSGPQVSDA